jgi:hypothetical protein
MDPAKDFAAGAGLGLGLEEGPELEPELLALPVMAAVASARDLLPSLLLMSLPSRVPSLLLLSALEVPSMLPSVGRA